MDNGQLVVISYAGVWLIFAIVCTWYGWWEYRVTEDVDDFGTCTLTGIVGGAFWPITVCFLLETKWGVLTRLLDATPAPPGARRKLRERRIEQLDMNLLIGRYNPYTRDSSLRHR